MTALFFFYSDSAGNILNIGGVIFVEAFALWFMTDAVAESSRSRFFKTLARLAALNILFYFVISVALARFMSIQNPIEDFLAGERVRLLAFQTGHSILIDLAFISMAIAVSNIARLGLLETISITTISIVSIFLAKSAGGYLVLISIGFAFAIEIIEVNKFIRALLYVPFFLAISVFFLQPDLLTDAIFYVRTELQGVSVSQYQNGDLSAGRALLNDMLTKVILENPWTGVGHDDPVIQYGTNIYSGLGLSERKTATTESGLRNAAQYGIPYFCCVVAFILQPLLIAFQSRERDVRIFCQALSFGLLTLLAVNSQFEVPHEPQHFIYFSLLALAVQFGLKRHSAVRKKRKTTNFARSAIVEQQNT
ncbi:O-antigen ligase family protein [Bradyrhizobium vignae]|nr:O-antigen ligase family protein [Bradyrhizobium vignae]